MEYFLEKEVPTSTHALSDIQNHRFNKNIISDGMEGAVKWKRKDGKIIPYPGITAKIRKKLYPNHKMTIGTSSRKLGTHVHYQLKHSVDCQEECNCPTKIRKYHKMVHQAYKLMNLHKLKPIAAEVPLISHKLHVATRLDMVCR